MTEQKISQSNPQPTPAASQPVSQPAAAATIPPQSGRSGNPWPWIVSGCLAIFIITLVAVILLGWWGVREVKKEINSQVERYEPTIEGVRENIDRMNEEGEAWEKKSEELRNALPDAEELEKEMGGTYPPPSGKKK